MATSENNVLLTYKDQSGNLYLLYPITKAELVDGLDEAMATRFTDEEKTKLEGIEAGANKFVLGDGTVTYAKLAADAKSKGVAATLPSSGWADNTQTVAVNGVTADNNVVVGPAPASREAWADAEIYCSAQSNGTLTFKCSSAPAENVTANVVILI